MAGLPVSSSHTLIGSILGVGLANSLITKGNMTGVNWTKATEVGLSLLISPIVGFVAAATLLLMMKLRLHEPQSLSSARLKAITLRIGFAASCWLLAAA